MTSRAVTGSQLGYHASNLMFAQEFVATPFHAAPQELHSLQSLFKRGYEAFAKPPISPPMHAAETPIASSRLDLDEMAGFQSELRTRQAVGQGVRITRSQSKARQAPVQPNQTIIDLLTSLQPRQQLAYLREIRGAQPRQYKYILSNIRAGLIKDPRVTLPVALDLATTTAHAHDKKEGRSSIQFLVNMYEAGRIKYGELKSGHALTTPDTTYDRQDPDHTFSHITLDFKMLSTPEGTAALLAHEGIHALRYYQGNLKGELLEEVDGVMAAAKVWSEFSSDKFNCSSEAREVLSTLQQFNQFFDPTQPNDSSRMLHEAASAYMTGYVDAKLYGRVVDVMDELFSSGFDAAWDGSDMQVVQMFRAIHTVREKQPSLLHSDRTAAQYNALRQRVLSMEP